MRSEFQNLLDNIENTSRLKFIFKKSALSNAIQQNLEQIDQQLNDIEQGLLNLDQHFTEKMAELDDTKQSLYSTNEKLQNTEIELSHTQETLEQISNDKEQLNVELLETKSSLDNVSGKLKDTEVELSYTKKTLEQISNDKEQLNVELSETKGSLDNVSEKLKNTEVELSYTKNSLAEVSEKLQKTESELDDTKNSLNDALYRERFVAEIISPKKVLDDISDVDLKSKVAVAGGFSAGKSEFISSLFKDKTLKLASSVEPTTAIPAYIFNGEQTRLLGKTQKKEWVDLLSIDENLHKKLTHQFMSQFSINLKQIMPEIYFQTPLEYANLCFIDTPGYNPASLEGTFTNEDKQTALDFVKDANALIWVISILSGTVPQSDLDFLREVVEHKEDMPIYVVLNKADLRPPSVQEEVLNNVIEVLEDYQIDVQGISVYSSLQGEEFICNEQFIGEFLSDFNDKSVNQKQFLQSIKDEPLAIIRAFATREDLHPETQLELAEMIVNKQFKNAYKIGLVLAKNPTLVEKAQFKLADYNRAKGIFSSLLFSNRNNIDDNPFESKYRYYSSERNFRDALLQNPNLVPELKEKLAN